MLIYVVILVFSFYFQSVKASERGLFKCNLPVSQSIPVNPETQLHRHVDKPSKSWHVPL